MMSGQFDSLTPGRWRPIFIKDGEPVALVVPPYDPAKLERYPGDIEPGYYNVTELVNLLRANSEDPQVILFIADMLEP